MRFEVLGPLRVVAGGADLVLGGPHQRMLLALLLATPNRAVSTDRLVDELWGDDPPPSAHHLVHVYVSRLRQLLDDGAGATRIVREGSGYLIRVGLEEVDALELEAGAARAREAGEHDLAPLALDLRAVTALWRGPPFGELADESLLLRSEAARLEELYLGLLESCIDVDLRLGRDRALVGELEGLTARYPYRERFWQHLALALYRCGRQVEAVRACQALRRKLLDDLGIVPGQELEELEERLLLHDPSLRWESPPPPGNLPGYLTSFVGRESEVSAVTKLLDVGRLVTLTGPGGIGKTRLAVEAARRVATRYPDGVWFVDLSCVTDTEQVAREVAASLGVAAAPGSSLLTAIVRALTRRHALLLVDSCEHLAPVVAEIVEAVLLGAPRMHTLATSRTPLRLPGEVLWPVPGMALPASGRGSLTESCDAVTLFLERARAIAPPFVLTATNVDDVVEVCRRLDGLPLAIEMAAGWARMLAPAQIVESLADRFAVLHRAEREAVSRHRTLEATVAWSYDLLAPELRVVFDRLSVFASTFDLESADAVACRGVAGLPCLDALAALVDASMVTPVREGEEPVRYRLLDSLRAFGARRLDTSGDAAATNEAHAEHFLALVVRAGESIGTPAFAGWVPRLRACYREVCKAVDWLLANRPRERALAAAPAMSEYWYRTADAREAGRWSSRLLEGEARAPAAQLAAAHYAAGFAASILGDPEASVAHAEAAVRLCRDAGDRRSLVTTLFGQSNAAFQVGDVQRAAACSREGLSLCDELGETWGRADHLALLSLALLMSDGPLDEARRLAEEAVILHRALGDVAGQVVMNPLPLIAMRQGELVEAERYATDMVGAAAGTGWEATALGNLGQVLLAEGETDRADAVLRRGLVNAFDTGLENWFRMALRDLARVAVERDDLTMAARLLGASRRNMPRYGLDPAIYDEVTARCRAGLGDDLADQLDAEGQALSEAALLGLVLGDAPPRVGD